MASLSFQLKRAVRGLTHLAHLSRAKKDKASGGVVKTVAISMVRNEQDIIEPFLRHHAQLFDMMFILDNRSTDNTRQVILSLARELGNIVLSDIPDRAYKQGQIMTRALHHIQSATFSEYVFFLDADEFVQVSDKSELDRHLANIPQGGVGLMPWKTFIPDPSIDESGVPDPLLRMKFTRNKELPQYYKAVFRAHGGIDPSITVDQGNHRLRDGFGRRLPSVELNDLPLMHFPLRSIDQLTAKGVLGWLANRARAKNTRADTDAYQWKRLYDLVEGGGRLSGRDLVREAMGYAQKEPHLLFEEGAVRADHGISTKRLYSDGTFLAADHLIDGAADVKLELADFSLPSQPQNKGGAVSIKNAFDGEWHWDYLFLDVPLIRFAVERFAPESILDLGCGNGLYPALYKHLGVATVLGVDGIEPEATILPKTMYCKVDLQLPFDSGRKFDLVFCLEVAEHLDPDATQTLFDTIAAHAQKTIIFSMAEPDQPGNGHINCLPISTVLDLWESRGWHPDLSMTLGCRAISSMAWFRRNLLVLTYTGETGATPDAQILRQIGALPFSWYSQPAGKRDTAFAEPLPALRQAYGMRIA